MDGIIEKDGFRAEIDLHRMRTFGRLLTDKDSGDSFEYRKNLALATFEIACVTTDQRRDQRKILTEEISRLIPFLTNEFDFNKLGSVLLLHIAENLASDLLNQARSGS